MSSGSTVMDSYVVVRYKVKGKLSPPYYSIKRYSFVFHFFCYVTFLSDEDRPPGAPILATTQLRVIVMLDSLNK